MTGRARSLISSQRGSGNLIDRARSAAAHLLNPPTQPARQQDDRLATVCTAIAGRDLDLLDSLLSRLEELSEGERNPDTLATLYGLDHLATRLRRNAETLRLLAGDDASDPNHEATPLLDTIRAALSSVEQYRRVTVGRVAALAVVGSAADDVSRLLAELLDNATIQSPPSSTVVVSAHLTEQGSVLVRVEDEGVGLSDADLAALNSRLKSDRDTKIGFAVVRRLAARHGIDVRLCRRSPHGTTASALLPADLVRESPPGPVVPVVRTTAGGLPRRIPRRRRTPELSVVESMPDRGEFMADLAAFAEGERAAKAERPSSTQAARSEVSEGDDVGGD